MGFFGKANIEATRDRVHKVSETWARITTRFSADLLQVLATTEELVKLVEAAEDIFSCPRCGASVSRLDIALHPAHDQEPPWNTGFEWVGSCPHCDADRRDKRK